MKITIDNFRGISHAEIETGAITALCGANGMGKTSIIQAVASALTSQAIPIEGLTKSSLGMLVHSGTASGEIAVRTPSGSVQVQYPSGTKSSDGNPTEITEYAAGAKSLLDYKTKDRVEIVNQVLNAYPTNADLIAELLCVGAIAAENQAKRLLDTVSVQGWDAAHAQAKEAGAKLKGRWEEATQQNWGTKIAATWTPAAWTAELETETMEALKNHLAQEEEFLKAAESDSAINADRLARLKIDADRIPQIQAGIDERKESLQALRKNLNEINDALGEIPELVNPAVQECPHCNGPLVVVGKTISKPITYSDNEIAERKAARMQSILAVEKLDKETKAVQAEIDGLSAEMYAAQKSKAEYERLSQRPTGNGEGKSVDEIKALVEAARAKIDAKTRKESADKIAADVGRNQLIVDVLDKEGLRKKKLAEKLTGLNTRLASVCQVAGWRGVAMKPDMAITYGGSPYMLVSESEKFRVRVVLQLAIASMDGSALVLIDGADILDSDGRTGLFKALMAMTANSVESIVAMTTATPPNLSKVGGKVYVVKSGTVEESR